MNASHPMVAPARPLVRFMVAAFVASPVFAGPAPARADDRIVLFADRDDDDANAVPDAEQPVVPSSSELFSVPIPKKGGAFAVRGNNVRLLADGVPIAPGA